MTQHCLSLILAAGEGTRMRSNLPKVLHKIGGLPMVSHVLRACMAAAGEESAVALIVGDDAAPLCAEALKHAPQAQFYQQKQRLGTAHAVLAAQAALEAAAKQKNGPACVLIAYGDTPLLRAETARAARDKIVAGADIVVSGFYAENPAGYGRLVEQNGRLIKIIEDKDASAAEKAIKLCNGGFMAARAEHILPLLRAVDNKNAKGEYYLTDIVALAAAQGLRVEVMATERDDVLGVNSRAELAAAELIWQNRRRQAVMAAGVTLQMPETVYFAYDTEIAADVLIEPNVYFGPGVKIGRETVIRAFSHIEGAEIGAHCTIGPYARLRPGAKLAENVRIGNFCEIKQSNIAEGVKINHLTYMGDAEIGAGSNIGAGVISCNYNGFSKAKLTIGAGAFIGSNSALIAPLTIGRGAYIASGSVITDNVNEDALAFGRARQEEKPEGGKRLRALFSLQKAEAEKAAKPSGEKARGKKSQGKRR